MNEHKFNELIGWLERRKEDMKQGILDKKHEETCNTMYNVLMGKKIKITK